MTHYVGLDVSQKTTAICVVDAAGRRLWRGQCASVPEMRCPSGRGAGGCEGSRWAACTSRKPVVDIAAPVLRTGCCGLADRGENRDPGAAA